MPSTTSVVTLAQNVGHYGNDNTQGPGDKGTKLGGPNIGPDHKEKLGVAGERQLRNWEKSD